jgi:hypothetical protein
MPTPYVIIEVKGGVAYVKRKTKGVKVVILDYDNYPKLSSALELSSALAHADVYRKNEEV